MHYFILKKEIIIKKMKIIILSYKIKVSWSMKPIINNKRIEKEYEWKKDSTLYLDNINYRKEQKEKHYPIF